MGRDPKVARAKAQQPEEDMDAAAAAAEEDVDDEEDSSESGEDDEDEDEAGGAGMEAEGHQVCGGRHRNAACGASLSPVLHQVWRPGVDEIGEDEELDYDPNAYDCLHAFQLEWPCLRCALAAAAAVCSRAAVTACLGACVPCATVLTSFAMSWASRARIFRTPCTSWRARKPTRRAATS